MTRRVGIERALYPSRSKYNVDQSAAGKEARTYQGITFHSKREMEVYRDYVLPNVHVGLFSNLRLQVRYPLHVTTPGGLQVKVGTYIADFVATNREGRPVIMDAKGKRTELYSRSRKHFEAQYGLRIIEL